MLLAFKKHLDINIIDPKTNHNALGFIWINQFNLWHLLVQSGINVNHCSHKGTNITRHLGNCNNREEASRIMLMVLSVGADPQNAMIYPRVKERVREWIQSLEA